MFSMLQPNISKMKSVNLLFLYHHYRSEYDQMNVNFRKLEPSCTDEMFETVMQSRCYLYQQNIHYRDSSSQFNMLYVSHAEHESQTMKLIFGHNYNFYLLPLDQFYDSLSDLSEPPVFGMSKDLEPVTSAADFAEIEINTRMSAMSKVLLEFHGNQKLKKNRIWKDSQFLKQLTHLIFGINHYYYIIKRCQTLAAPHEGSLNLLSNLQAKEVDLMEKFLDLLQNTFLVTQEPDSVYTMPTPCQAKGSHEDEKKRSTSEKTKAKSVLLEVIFLAGLVPYYSTWMRICPDVTLYVVGQHSDNTTLESFTVKRRAYTETLSAQLRQDMKIRVMKDDIVFVAQNITRTGRTKRLSCVGDKRSLESNEPRVAGGDIYTIVMEFQVAFQLSSHFEEPLPSWCLGYIKTEEIKGAIKTCTIPIAFIGHTDQKPAAEGYLFWTEFNPFPHTKPLFEPERVPVKQFIVQVKKYTFDRTQRDLSNDEVEYLLKKIPRRDKANEIRRDNILRYPAEMTGRHPGNGKSFWIGWFWKVLNVIQKSKTLLDLWKRGIVCLLEADKAQTILHNSPSTGSAIIRMSETNTDGVLNLVTKQKHLKENNESTSTFQINIDNKIIESLSHDINTLKLDYFWQQGKWINSDYVKSSRLQKTRSASSGYDDPLTVLVPRVVGMKLSNSPSSPSVPDLEQDTNHRSACGYKTEIPHVETFLSCSHPDDSFGKNSWDNPQSSCSRIKLDHFNDYPANFSQSEDVKPGNAFVAQNFDQNSLVLSEQDFLMNYTHTQLMSQFPQNSSGWSTTNEQGLMECAHGSMDQHRDYASLGNFD